MALCNSGTLIISRLLMSLVVTMVRVYEVVKLPNFVLEIDCFDFGIM